MFVQIISTAEVPDRSARLPTAAGPEAQHLLSFCLRRGEREKYLLSRGAECPSHIHTPCSSQHRYLLSSLNFKRVRSRRFSEESNLYLASPSGPPGTIASSGREIYTLLCLAAPTLKCQITNFYHNGYGEKGYNFIQVTSKEHLNSITISTSGFGSNFH